MGFPGEKCAAAIATDLVAFHPRPPPFIQTFRTNSGWAWRHTGHRSRSGGGGGRNMEVSQSAST